MGGQACVFYGAAEFSRDCDIVIVADDDNLTRLKAALSELMAECIAIPPFEPQFWDKGHAIHFRCHHVDAKGIRLDVMTKMRGCDSFEELWGRRMTLQDEDGVVYEILGIEDLVKAKKTQRDKDWPMIQRLVDAHYDAFQANPTDDQVRFWLKESRNPEVLITIAATYPEIRDQLLSTRPVLLETFSASRTAVKQSLHDEELKERIADEQYWQPLKAELVSLRFSARKNRQRKDVGIEGTERYGNNTDV
jgi:hypothetical protein